MDDGKYNDWFFKKLEDNQALFAETMSDEFDDFCFERYISRDTDLADRLYDQKRDDDAEKQI